jgi:hypothetical protein
MEHVPYVYTQPHEDGDEAEAATLAKLQVDLGDTHCAASHLFPFEDSASLSHSDRIRQAGPSLN